MISSNQQPGQSTGFQGTFILIFMAASGVTMIGSLVSFFLQMRQARRDARTLEKKFLERIDQDEQKLAHLAEAEINARLANDPLLTRADILRRTFIWQRRSRDPDYLSVRVGTGRITPLFAVQAPDKGNTITVPPRAIPGSKVDFERLRLRAERLAERYQRLKPEIDAQESPANVRMMADLQRDVPVTVTLTDHLAVISSDLQLGAAVISNVIGHLAIHHSPADVAIIVLAPLDRAKQWNWIDPLPHTKRDRFSFLGFHPENRQHIQTFLLDELFRRSQEIALQHGSGPLTFSPHLVIVLDAFADNDQSPLDTAALGLALRRGHELGATVITLNPALHQAPVHAKLVLALTSGRTATLQIAAPQTPAPLSVVLDEASSTTFDHVSRFLEPLKPEIVPGLQMPRQVDLLPLLKLRADPVAADIQRLWDESRKAKTKGVFVPLGRKLGGELLSIDLTDQGDGPHGLLIGQTGSGKSVLLQSLVMALALRYGPDQLNLVLVDYKGGLAFNAFERLPHTVALLTNMDQAGQTRRFLHMLRFELERRQSELDKGNPPPHLVVIIDEFAEMISHQDGSDNTKEAIMDSLLSIVRLGRQLRVHLLFASQRLESSIMQRLRGYMQFRICLRTNTREDSMEVLGRPDASELPANTPGRGYLLRGNNELMLFQAPRLTLPVPTTPNSDPRTPDEELTDRMYGIGKAAKPWPRSLPTPTINQPTPLYLIQPPGGRARLGSRACHLSRDDQHPLMVPLGLYDRPEQQVQDWFLVDLHGYQNRIFGGPLILLGDLNAGKTTALQSLALFLVRNWSPRDFRLCVLDPSLAFAPFRGLPHCLDPDTGQSLIVQGGDKKELESWLAMVAQAMDTPPTHRPRLVCLIDDYDELVRLHSDQPFMKLLPDLLRRGRDQATYLAVASSRLGFKGFSQDLYDLMATRVILFTSNKDSFRSAVGGRVPFYPEGVPGRGFVLTRRGDIDEVQLMSPVPGILESERQKHLVDAINAIGLQYVTR